MPNACHVPGHVPLRRVGFLLAVLLLVAGLPSRVDAAERSSKTKGRAQPPAADAHSAATGKIAVFAFEGDDVTNVRKHVLAALTNQGLQVETSLKPAQTHDEFRDMGATLDLAAYVHGKIKELPGDKAEATITVRSGVTGRTIAATTFVGYRRGIRFDVEEKLWERIGKVITQACRDAKKPRRPVSAPTHIEAGTPL